MFLELFRACFQVAAEQQACVSHCSALFTLNISVRIHYWMLSVMGKVYRTSPHESHQDFIINGLLSNLLSKFSSLQKMGQLLKLHWEDTSIFYLEVHLFPVFLFMSSVWLVTHIWFSENFKSFQKSILYWVVPYIFLNSSVRFASRFILLE